jgi:hypothetical protein
MRKTLSVIAVLLVPLVIFDPPAQAQITDKTPYYMCFAYTADGMFFAGGEFKFVLAKKMLSVNCGMPKQIKVVLLKTIMSHDSKTTLIYHK